jgi:hypothetical protein
MVRYPRIQINFSGPGAATAMGLPRGGGDDNPRMAVSALRPAYCSRTAKALHDYLGLVKLARPSVPPLLCPTDECLSAMEVGPSRCYEATVLRPGVFACFRPLGRMSVSRSDR